MWKSIKAIAILFVFQFILIIPLMLLPLERDMILIIGLTLSYMAVIPYFYYIEKVGISSDTFKQRPIPTLALCICITPFLIALTALIGASMDLPNNLDISTENIPFLLSLAGIGLLGPVAEEIVFRGAVLGSLLKWEKIENEPWMAIFLSALFFSIVHFNPAQAPGTFIAGLVTGWLFYRTGSLIPGIVIHILNNSIACLAKAFGEDSDAIRAIDESDPSLAFLLVASIIVGILLVLMLRWLVRVVNRDMPAGSIWSREDPDAGIDKASRGKLGICFSIMAAFVALLFIIGSGHHEKQELIDTFGDFHEGLAEVKMDGKTGFIDKDGKIVIPCEYDSGQWFREGLCAVKKDKHWGYVDKDGNAVIPMVYDEAGLFFEAYASVRKDGRTGFIDTDGNIVLPFDYDHAVSFQDGKAIVAVGKKYGVVDVDGKEIVPFEYDYIYPFHDGIAMVLKDCKYGYVDYDGVVVIPIEYDSASLFMDGLSTVSKDGRYGIVDGGGKVVVSLQYDSLQKLDDSLFFARSGDVAEIINTSDGNVTPFNYDTVFWYSNGSVMVGIDEGKSCLVDLEGTIRKEFDYKPLSGLNDGLARAGKGGKEGFVNAEGDIVIAFEYDKAGSFSEGLAKACRGKHRYYIDKKGGVVIELD